MVVNNTPAGACHHEDKPGCCNFGHPCVIPLDGVCMCHPASMSHHASMSHPCLQALARVVSSHMGGASKSDAELMRQWQKHSRQLRRQHGSVVIPISALTCGLARHRALLFKVLADFCQIPCRLLRGQFYTGNCILHFLGFGIDLWYQTGWYMLGYLCTCVQSFMIQASLVSVKHPAAGGRLFAPYCRGHHLIAICTLKVTRETLCA